MKKITSLFIIFAISCGYANDAIDKFTNTTIPATYEAEKGKRYKGANEQDCASCSELKQVGDIGGPSLDSGYLVVTVNAATAGNYTLNLSFSSGDTRSVFISANGMAPQEISLNSGSWGTVGTRDMQIMLNAGTNSIKFYNHASYAPNIDKFTLNLLEAAPACLDCIGPFEAESAVITGVAKSEDCETCSGGKQIGDMGYSDRYITQTVTAVKAGIYKLYLSYSSESERSISITPNGDDLKTVSALCNSFNWGVIFVKSFDIELMAGTNTLKFHTPGNWSPNIDQFRLVFSSTLSVNDNVLENFSAYPNPTSTTWKISNNNDAIESVSVFDLSGKQVLLLSPNATEATIDGASLKSGLYLSKIKTGKGFKNIKLIKE